MTPEEKNRQLIENAAREAVRASGADPFILPDLAARLEVYSDPKAGEGDASLVVRAKADPKITPEQSLAAMSKEAEFAPRFDGAAPFWEGHEAARKGQSDRRIVDKVQSEIDAEIKRIAPDGDPMRLAPNVKVRIAREVREANGLPARETKARTDRRPSPSQESAAKPGASGTVQPIDYVSKLKEQRRAASATA
jgi:hypothetical protein